MRRYGIETKNRVEKKVYAKDSMDRFGDDLTEEVIQYLTFKDKVRLECVSKPGVGNRVCRGVYPPWPEKL